MNYHKSIAATIAQNDGTSSAIDLEGWRKVSIELPAQSSGALDSSSASITLTGCGTSTGTFVPLVCDGTNALGTTAAIVSLGTEAFPKYIRINSDSTATAAAGYLAKVHVID